MYCIDVSFGYNIGMRQKHHKHEQTLVIIKPDGIQRSLIGKIISRYERIGLKLVGSKMLIPTPSLIEGHYTIDSNWKKLVGEKQIKSAIEKGHPIPIDEPEVIGQRVLSHLMRYFSSGPVIAMVWEGAHAVNIVRKITGSTEPKTSDVGTIRGDFMLDSYEMSESDSRSIRNLVHASGSISDAEAEILHWFEPNELHNYRIIQEQVLYEADMGILNLK